MRVLQSIIGGLFGAILFGAAAVAQNPPTYKLCDGTVAGCPLIGANNPLATTAGGGGGGGPITAALGSYAAGALSAGAFAAGAGTNGWDIAQGNTADAAYAGSGSASVISLLKGVYASVNGAIPAGTNTIGAVNSVNVVSTTNSSAVALGAAGVFTGTAYDGLNASSYSVSVISNVASATDGLSIQQSSDGTNWDITDVYTVPAATGKVFVVQKAARYMRVVYTNGGTLQTSFRLQVIANGVMQVSTSQRPSDTISNDNDFAMTMAANILWDGTTNWVRQRGDVTNGAFVQIKAMPNGAGTITTPAVTPGTFATLLAANTARKSCLIQNNSTTIGYVYPGTLGSATTSNSFQVQPGGTFGCADSVSVETGAINATCGTGGTCAFVVSTK